MMTIKVKNMSAAKANNSVSVTERKNASESVKCFSFVEAPKLFNPITRNILVLDLTGDYLKYSLFVRQGHHIHWLEAGEIPGLSPGSQEHSKSIETGLKIISSRLSLKNTKILLVKDGTGFFLRRLKIPELKGEAFKEAIKWTCAKQIPYPIEEAYLNVLNIEKADGLLKILVAVVKKESLDQYSFLGRKLLGVVPSPLALGGNYLKQSQDQNTIDILLHWGDSEAIIDYIHAGCFEFSNNFKLEKNLGESLSTFSGGIAEKIETNLKNSLDFYYSVYPGQQINQIKLPGESSRETIERINRLAQIETQNANPFGSLVEDHEKLNRFWDSNKSKYLLCAGAVQLETKYQYLPSTIARLARYQKLKAIAGITSITLTLFLILLGWLFSAERTNYLNRIESINGNIKLIENSNAYVEVVKLENLVNKAASALSQFKPSSAWVSSFLKAVSLSISSGVYFNQMHLSESGVDPGKIELRIEGYYFGELEKADVKLAELVENLNQDCGLIENKFERLGERFESSNKYINFALTGSVRINQWTAE